MHRLFRRRQASQGLSLRVQSFAGGATGILGAALCWPPADAFEAIESEQPYYRSVRRQLRVSEQTVVDIGGKQTLLEVEKHVIQMWERNHVQYIPCHCFFLKPLHCHHSPSSTKKLFLKHRITTESVTGFLKVP